ncbi:MAG: hypothetical protein M5R36_12180 [Deltaproteobacteria bacterium]|nr:hypothetical protein [Deltaproteobacteria bacterium]
MLMPLAALGVANICALALGLFRERTLKNTIGVAAAASAIMFAGIQFGLSEASDDRIEKFVKKPIVNTFKLQSRGEYFREQADRLDLRPGTLLEIDMGGIGEASGMIIYDVGKLCDVPFGVNQWDKNSSTTISSRKSGPTLMHAREGVRPAKATSPRTRKSRPTMFCCRKTGGWA